MNKIIKLRYIQILPMDTVITCCDAWSTHLKGDQREQLTYSKAAKCCVDLNALPFINHAKLFYQGAELLRYFYVKFHG